MSYPILETQRLILRAPGASDTGAMMGFLSEARAQFYGGPLSGVEAWTKYAGYVGQWILRGYGMYAITPKETGATIGMAGPYHPADFPEPEMSWLLTSAAHEGQGYAKEACSAVLAHAFATGPWTTLPSFIDVQNHASRALALALGAVADPDTASPFEGCETYHHFAGGAA